MKLYKFVSATTLLLGLCLAPQAQAQQVLPEGTSPLVVTPHAQTVDYKERTLCYDILANVPFEASSSESWVQVRKDANGSLYVHVSENYATEPRTATLTFKNTEKQITETMVLTQGADQSVNTIPQDIVVKAASASDNNHQDDSSTAQMTIDGSLSTMYHSRWNPADISADNPAILTYTFRNVERIDYVNYVARQSGNNGNFREVEIYAKYNGSNDFALLGSYNFGGGDYTVKFDGGLVKPTSIKFVIKSGTNNFASCAEMQFRAKNASAEASFAVFADDIYSELKPGVTEAQIQAIENPFAKKLALQLFRGTYDKEYRVASYPCEIHYSTLSNLWNAPGKNYDQIAGVTGITLTKGTHAVVVSGIPDDLSVQLKVVAWYVGKEGNNFDGGNPNTTTFSLRNGLNVINYSYDWDGLAYICYYDAGEDTWAQRPPLKVHFVNGVVNGYLSPEKSNEQMHQICKNAKNICMDLKGIRTHCIWTSDGLYKYCKSIDGKLGYRQYMNIMDSLIVWEHRSLGFEKYGRVPKLRTMAYVNYTYYMFQGGFGVSFHHNQEGRVLNCRTIAKNDEDAIWGLSHEWGHQHQMTPYFCWAGMSETTNNVQSYYNIMHMGYKDSRGAANARVPLAMFLEDKTYGDGKHVSGARRNAYINRDRVQNPALKKVCEAMKDSLVKPMATDPLHAVNYIDDGDVGIRLFPIIMFHNYFIQNGFPDISKDWYEALRQNDDPNGSQVEKQGEADKYELIASCQNWNKNNKLPELRQRFPESCWVKNNYCQSPTGNDPNMNAAPFMMNFVRKVSRLVGMNMMPYFERWGWFRQVAGMVGDYGDKWYIMPEDMYNEYKADMDALGLPAVTDQQIEDISRVGEWLQPAPDFAN